MIQPSPDQINVHVFISGKVQGVGYRFSTAQQAKKRGINGWVKNLPDGRVEAIFEGSQPVIEEMLNWCAQGPTMANVANVEVNKEPTKSFNNFQVID